MTTSETTTHTLARQWRRGDESAATELYLRYMRRLNQLVRFNLSNGLQARLGTSDICQSAFKSMFRGMREGRFHFDDDAEVWKLLVTITLNKIRNKVRFEKAPKRDYRRDRSFDNPHEFDRYRAGCLCRVPNSSEVQEFQCTLESLLARLNPAETDLLRLRLEGRTQEEIAQTLGVTDRTVRRSLVRIRDKARDLLAPA